MCRKERSHISVYTTEKFHDPVILGLGETETSVLFRNFHSESSHLGEAINHLLRVFAGPVNLHRVDLFDHECFELIIEFQEFRPFLHFGKRIDQIKSKVSQEQFFQKARVLPILLARSLRNLERLALFFIRGRIGNRYFIFLFFGHVLRSPLMNKLHNRPAS